MFVVYDFLTLVVKEGRKKNYLLREEEVPLDCLKDLKINSDMNKIFFIHAKND